MTGTSLIDTIPPSSKLDELNYDPNRDPLRDQPQAIVLEMYVPIGYPSKKLEFFIRDVFNVTEYQSTKVLDKINAQAFQRARKRESSLEFCYYLICKHIFDHFTLKKT